MKARLPQGMGGGAPQNMQGVIKQAQKMQEQITKVQEEIESRDFSVTVGGGAIEAVMQGNKQLKSISIKPEIVNAEEVEMLQDLIVSAVNEGVKQIEETMEKEMGAITGAPSR